MIPSAPEHIPEKAISSHPEYIMKSGPSVSLMNPISSWDLAVYLSPWTLGSHASCNSMSISISPAS